MSLRTEDLAPRKKLLFVINPISGGKKKDKIPIFIRKYLDHKIYEYKVLWWQSTEELQSMLCPTVLTDYFGVVAVGGDGTVNVLAKFLKNTHVALGILPMGSGNGLARALGIPLDLKNAIRHLNHTKCSFIDLGCINGHIFVNVAGIGFDATVSKRFKNFESRGFTSYVRSVLSEFFKSRTSSYKVDWETGNDQREGFMLSVANGNQWGNDFFVAPEASLDDGILDVVVLPKPRWNKVTGMIKTLVSKTLKPSWRVEKLNIKLESPQAFHIDGEYIGEAKEFDVHNLSCALAVMA
jgi:diacylglycerol kinase (ATP)